MGGGATGFEARSDHADVALEAAGDGRAARGTDGEDVGCARRDGVVAGEQVLVGRPVSTSVAMGCGSGGLPSTERRGWDSNPRDRLTRPNGFQDRRIRPLCHPSERRVGGYL